MTKRSVVWALLLAAGASGTLRAQDIRGRYVSKTQEDGTIYHTFPCTLFEHPEAGDLTFDITYKERTDGLATLNFTCEMAGAESIDSVCFAAGGVCLRGAVGRLYIEPDRKRWKHRYSLRTPVAALCPFFDAEQLPEARLYAGERVWVYRAKRSAWRSYAPVGRRIFEMVRVNEAAGRN